MSIEDANYIIRMDNGESWSIPVAVIASSRDAHYKKGDSIELFSTDDFEIEDWAKNNMNWGDVKKWAKCIEREFDYDDGWANGESEIALYDSEEC